MSKQACQIAWFTSTTRGVVTVTVKVTVIDALKYVDDFIIENDVVFSILFILWYYYTIIFCKDCTLRSQANK